MNKCVSILNFSPRNSGNCGTISEFIANYHSGDECKIFHIGAKVFGPCEGCDLECLKMGVSCPKLQDQERQIMDQLLASDLVYFVVPNFCGYPSASYFAFNERTVGYFNMDREKMGRYMAVQKRFVVVSNTEGFEAVMTQQAKDPKILYLKTRKYHRNSIAGDLMDCEEARNDLLRYLEQFEV